MRHVHAVLRGALGQAVRWGWLPSNPAASASPRSCAAVRSSRRRSATHRLLEAADEYDPDFGALLRVLVATGARRGEVCGLRWSDVDLSASTVTIRRSVASVAGGTVVKETKTHAARRIAVDPETLQALAQRTGTAAEHWPRRAGCALDSARLRVHVGAGRITPLHPNTITGGFQRLVPRPASTASGSTTFATSTRPSCSPPAYRSGRSAVASATPTRRRP